MNILDSLHVTNPSPTAAGRIESVDALRGFDMFWIIGGEYILKGLDNAIHYPATNFISTQLDHVEWTGFRFYDIIMPLFLLIVGVAIPFITIKSKETHKNYDFDICRYWAYYPGFNI
jgi:predicted acyltransferase